MADTLKEFLVKIKYQQEGQKELKRDVESTGTTIIDLGKKIIGATAAAAVGVSKLAQSYEQLYFVSSRTRTTVDNLRALQTASASLGSSAEGARSSLESMAAFMRNTPSSSNWMAGWGVQTKDAKGNQLDSVAIMKNVATRFQQFDKTGNGYMAHQYAAILGIDSNEEMAMRDPHFNGQLDSFRSDLKNANEQGTGKAAHDAVNIGRHKRLEVESFESRGLKGVLDTFNSADASTKGFSTDVIAGAVAVVGLTVAAKTLTGVFQLLAGSSAVSVAGGAAGAIPLAAGIAGAIPLAAGVGALAYSPNLNSGEDEIMDKMYSNYRKKITKEKLLDGIRWQESRGNPNAVSPKGAIGAYQLMPATAKAMGIDPLNEQESRVGAGRMMDRLIKKYHGNTNQALQAYNWGEGNMDSYIKTGFGLHHRVMPRETKDYPGQVANGMNITTTINVIGATNPLVTAQAVQAAQTRTYQLAARNTAGVTR